MATYSHFPDPFSPLTTESAWVLGLWFTDGNVNSAGYISHLTQKDKELLDNVARIIAPGDLAQRIKMDDHVGAWGHKSFRLRISSKDFAHSLSRFGINSNKSKVMEFPTIPEDLLADFMRGVFDGDGSISRAPRYRPGFRAQVSIGSGSYVFLTTVAQVVSRVVQRPVNIHEQKGFYSIIVRGRQAMILCEWMYSPSTEKTRLRRKYERFIETKNEGSNYGSHREQVKEKYRIYYSSPGMRAMMKEKSNKRWHPETDINVLRPDADLVEDGFGSAVSIVCPMCGNRTMQVVRPGKFQCSECG